MEEKINQLRQEAAEIIRQQVENLSQLNDIRVKYLGKKGEITNFLRSLEQLSKEDRPRIGQIVNEARHQLEALIEEKNAQLKTEALKEKLSQEKIDVTLQLPDRKSVV